MKRYQAVSFLAILTVAVSMLSIPPVSSASQGVQRGYSYLSIGSSASPTLASDTYTPASGNETTVFTFRVQYGDNDNNPPNPITITIDGGAPIPMTKENPADNKYGNGCWYKYSTTLGAGNHVYSIYCSDGSTSASITSKPGPAVTSTSSSSGTPDDQDPLNTEAARAAATTGIVIGCIGGGILAFSLLVIYRDRLPSKMQRVIPSKYAIKDVGSKIKDKTGTTGRKIKGGFKDAGYKIRTFFTDLAFKIKHR